MFRVTRIQNVFRFEMFLEICSSFYFASNRSRRLSNPAQFGLESYSNNENRRWCLNAMDPGRRVFIEFEIFHSELCCDYLEVKMFMCKRININEF